MHRPNASIFVFALIISIISCTTTPQKKIDIQGHRGARGLAPENSIQAFQRAMDNNVNTLELDVVISRDQKVVVSHEAWFNPKICTIETDNPKTTHNIYKMDYKDIKKIDCGSKKDNRFPDRLRTKTYKPLLSEVIQTVKRYADSNGKKIPNFNIEIKTEPNGVNLFNPDPEIFCLLVVELLDRLLDRQQYTLQSFDQDILRELHTQHSDIALSFLVEDNVEDNQTSTQNLISQLGFEPDIYSPNFQLLNKQIVDWCHTKSIKVIPWTVNNTSDFEYLLQIGVDGVITDYPNKIKNNR